MTTIRPAIKDDLHEMVFLGGVMYEESNYSRYTYDPAKAAGMILHLIESNEGIALVAEDKGEVIGGFLGTIGEHWFGTCKYSFDFALFVHPDKRGSSVAPRLIKKYIEQANELGVDSCMIGCTTGVETERTEMLFEKMGFKRLGSSFLIDFKGE